MTEKPSQRATKPPVAVLGPVQMLPEVRCTGVPGIGGIYRISCARLNRHYIGQTSDLARRWLEHQVDLGLGRHTNPGLQDAYRRFGPQGLTFWVLEVFKGRWDEAVWTLAEQRWIDLHRGLNKMSSSLFNVRPAGTNNWLRRTKEGRAADQATQAARRSASTQSHFARRNRHHF